MKVFEALGYHLGRDLEFELGSSVRTPAQDTGLPAFRQGGSQCAGCSCPPRLVCESCCRLLLLGAEF